MNERINIFLKTSSKKESLKKLEKIPEKKVLHEI